MNSVSTLEGMDVSLPQKVGLDLFSPSQENPHKNTYRCYILPIYNCIYWQYVAIYKPTKGTIFVTTACSPPGNVSTNHVTMSSP